MSAKLIDTFALDGVPVSQRWAVTVKLQTQEKTYIAIRGVQSGKISIHGVNSAPLTSKLISQVLAVAKAAIEAALEKAGG